MFKILQINYKLLLLEPFYIFTIFLVSFLLMTLAFARLVNFSRWESKCFRAAEWAPHSTYLASALMALTCRRWRLLKKILQDNNAWYGIFLLWFPVLLGIISNRWRWEQLTSNQGRNRQHNHGSDLLFPILNLVYMILYDIILESKSDSNDNWMIRLS